MDARRSALAARVVDRRAELPRLRRERRQAGRARAHRRRARDLRRRRGARRDRSPSASSRSDAASAPPSPRTLPPSGPWPASCWCRRSTACTAIGSHHYPWLPVSLLLRHRFDAQADARRDRMPLLAIVARADTIIPVERSRALYDAWAGPKTWQSCRRRTTTRSVRSPDFWDGIARFLARAVELSCPDSAATCVDPRTARSVTPSAGIPRSTDTVRRCRS